MPSEDLMTPPHNMVSSLPADVLLLICEELGHKQDFGTLFNCALSSKGLVNPALSWLYRYVPPNYSHSRADTDTIFVGFIINRSYLAPIAPKANGRRLNRIRFRLEENNKYRQFRNGVCCGNQSFVQALRRPLTLTPSTFGRSI